MTLTVTNGTAGVPDVKVYFQNADSSVVLATTTDANGVASAVMVAGGYVTAIDALPAQFGGIQAHHLQTFANVKPGDHLVLHADAPIGTGTQVNFTFTMADEPSGNALTYQAWAPPCVRQSDVSGAGSGAPPGGVVNLDGCPATTDVAVIALNSGGEAFASIFKTNVAISDGGSVDLSNLNNTPWVNSDLVSYTFQNVPGSVAGFSVQSFAMTPKGIVFEIDLSNSVNSGSGGVSDLVRPKLDGTTQVDLSSFDGPANSRYRILEWGAPKVDYLVADTAAILPHEYTAPPTFDVATNTISWTSDAGGVAPNFVRAGLNAGRNKGNPQWFWEIADSAATTSVKLPTLPAPDDVFNATPTDDFANVNELTTGHITGGYDAIRAGLLSIPSNTNGNPVGLVIGASGQIVLEDFVEFQPAKPRRPTVTPFTARPAWKPARR